jgi:hypothetical protein
MLGLLCREKYYLQAGLASQNWVAEQKLYAASSRVLLLILYHTSESVLQRWEHHTSTNLAACLRSLVLLKYHSTRQRQASCFVAAVGV